MKQRQSIQTFHYRQSSHPSLPSTVELGNTRYKPMGKAYLGSMHHNTQKYS